MKQKKIKRIIILFLAIFFITGCRESAWNNMLEELPEDRRSLINELSCTYESTNYKDKIHLIFYVQNDRLRLKTWLNSDSPNDLDIIADDSDIGLSQNLSLVVDNNFLEDYGNYFLDNNKCMNFQANEKNSKITLVSSGGSINFKLTSEKTTPINTKPSAEVSKAFFNTYRGMEDVITFSVVNGEKFIEINKLSKTKLTGSDIEIIDANYKYYISSEDISKIFIDSSISGSYYLARDEATNRFVITMNKSAYSIVYTATDTTSFACYSCDNGYIWAVTPPTNKNCEKISGVMSKSACTETENSGNNDSTDNCTGFFEGTYFGKILTGIFSVMRMAGVGLVLVLSIIDYAGATIANNEDLIKKASEKIVKRLIIAVVIFFLPIILNILLSLVDGIGKICI